MIFELGEEIVFPDPRLGEENGLFAIGGDLSMDRLLLAYNYGIFPWFSFRDWPHPAWYCPMKRFVIFPDEIHVSHSMRTLFNKNKYQFSINNAFEDVMRNCAEVNNRNEQEGAWLGEHIIKAYTELHRQRFAASVEVWDEDDNLVGGLYGVNIGHYFVGESMFSRVPSGSKLALIYLAKVLQRNGGTMIDCQLKTPHLESMGGRYISYDEYMKIIK